MSQSVVVIGASGFIGGHVIRRLAAHGLTVNATRLPSERTDEIPGVDWIIADATSPEFAAALPRRCDALIYLAQAPDWRDFPRGATGVLAVNVAGPVRAAEYARRAGAAHFLYASSGSVYAPSARLFREEDPIDLGEKRGFYAASKIAAEVLLRPYGDLFPVVILRLFVPYGPGLQPPMLMAALADNVREGLAIRLAGADGMILNPVAVADVAETFDRGLELDRSATLNVAGSEVVSLRTIGETIGLIVGAAPVFDVHPELASPSLVGDVGALRALLGWAPSVSLEEGLRAWLG